MKHSMIVTDLDGTLLKDDGSISSFTLDTLRKVKEKGYYIVVATGRTFESARSILQDITLFDYLLLNNGAFFYDVERKESYYFDTILKEDCIKVVEEYGDYFKKVDACTGYLYYTYKGKMEDDIFFIKKIENMKDIPETEKISKMNLCVKNQEDIKFLLDSLQENYPRYDIFVMQDSFSTSKMLMIMPKNLNKKTSLARLCQKLGLSLDEVIAFGDGRNDIGMLKSVGYPVAVSTALEEVKEVAKEITLSNEEDGVAYFLEKKILNGKE